MKLRWPYINQKKILNKIINHKKIKKKINSNQNNNNQILYKK
jgi:hypothetical protein